MRLTFTPVGGKLRKRPKSFCKNETPEDDERALDTGRGSPDLEISFSSSAVVSLRYSSRELERSCPRREESHGEPEDFFAETSPWSACTSRSTTRGA